MQQDTIYTHQEFEHVSFYKKSRLFFIDESVRDGQVTTYLQLAQKWKLSNKIWQLSLFY